MADSTSLRGVGFSSAVLKDHGKRKQFISKLSYSQRSSFEVLLEWLDSPQPGRDVDRETTKRAKSLNITTYRSIMARLRDSEIRRRFGRKPCKPSELASLRRMAMCYAACERISSSYWRLAPPPSKDIFLTPNTPLHGASLVADITFDHETPYYLWDCQRRETRTVQEIVDAEGSFPDYVAISHSWVRWQDTSAPRLELPGVPWEIPRNKKFDVEKLPDMLAALPWRYAWIDLFTIPQGYMLTTEMRRRQDWEIKSAPLIFRKALKAVAWLDDLPSWSSLPRALEYLSLQYLSSASSTSGVDKNLLLPSIRTAAADADKPLELLRHDPNRQAPADDIWEPNAWFTSMWSLQEAIMRPDVLLCNGTWEFLEIGNGVPIALNDIAAFLRVCSGSAATTQPQPLCVRELYQLFERAGLMNLLELTRETSVMYVEKLAGFSPVSDRAYPQIVSSGGTGNPHDKPSTTVSAHGRETRIISDSA
ncbi:hypothetical protein F5Y00DRAFT_271912 [Daldinia vernicosa]|uniref:uncharacterized protein n=1 Tax=Daldinia vernicosa TaxID=114800 RepID=UPI002008192D|nr:uncharacterized protein F5Y00DRAFT_271912 [Daldinia vernicosa]KAI0846619.1 hypothetical protein F5Y00DRAFT_271912 [Daldinia vernicosa]